MMDEQLLSPESIDAVTVEKPIKIAKPRRSSKKQAPNEHALDDIVQLTADMIAVGAMFLWSEYVEILPESQEWNAFLQPLGRIVARHMSASLMMSPDLRDLMLMLSTAVMYAIRIAPLVVQKQAAKQPEQETNHVTPQRANTRSDPDKITTISRADNILDYYGQAIP